MILAVSTFDRVGGLVLIGLVIVTAVLDRVQRCSPPRRRSDAARLPGTARHRGRVEAGMFPAAEARTREGRGATPGVPPSAAAPSHRVHHVVRCERPRA